MVHENWRFRPWYRELKRWVDAGELGAINMAQISIMHSGLLPDAEGRRANLERQPFVKTEPRLMLVDEPTVGLAPNLAEQVYELLHLARKATSAAILLVDQNVADALRHAEDVVMMNLGKVKAAGPIGEFPETRVHALVQECLLG